jgi:hypothetical protein
MSRHNNRSTIKSVINEGLESKLNIKELSIKDVIINSAGEKFVVNMFNLYEKYYEILLDYTTTVVLDEKEYLKYRFKPKLLSYDLYGTKELHYMLLRLNYMYSVVNFDLKEIRVFTRNVIPIINEIMVIEAEEFIDSEVSVIKKLNE